MNLINAPQRFSRLVYQNVTSYTTKLREWLDKAGDLDRAAQATVDQDNDFIEMGFMFDYLTVIHGKEKVEEAKAGWDLYVEGCKNFTNLYFEFLLVGLEEEWLSDNPSQRLWWYYDEITERLTPRRTSAVLLKALMSFKLADVLLRYLVWGCVVVNMAVLAARFLVVMVVELYWVLQVYRHVHNVAAGYDVFN